ncbi:MAG: hypothetical protein EOO07_26025 [Chitinophagaceae bacterium]|nr:MAG: hypothetical protein EOO07_26025 [Chitinophagaceae bacterium]
MNLKDICVACGVDDYLAKPYDLEDLSAKVHHLMDYEQ